MTDVIGPGPFSIVLPPILQPFTRFLVAESTIRLAGTALLLGPLTVETANARLWSSRPDWQALYHRRAQIAIHLDGLQRAIEGRASRQNSREDSGESWLATRAARLRQTILHNDFAACSQAARSLAGLGVGLTPAGDDYLVGAAYALWSSLPAEVAAPIVGAIAHAATPHTTLLSAAWLRAAARGEASEAWHMLVSGMVENDQDVLRVATNRILAAGHTSGVFALAGFREVLADILTEARD